MRIHALPDDVLARARELAGTDEHHELHDESPGAPLRCCLRKAGPGEPVILFRHTPTAGTGPYEELGPVFAHAEPCDGPATTAEFPEAFRHAPRILRAYTADGRIHGGEIATPDTLTDRVDALLDDPDVAEVQVRSVSHGCFLFAITRDRA
ncbi:MULTISPECIES: DUF1203 domain-containing protein [Saccharothrix]|uniref:DUF1203 domain-containing protein n=1 Tax=Saccharothrix TaxID=2071 RepID=UPI000939F94C|nr:DUF1203 domain-containing protein [Saccharothrix sp. CB00851]OKI37188.1 hypothetical protein A6A25_19415 [Saccharothrix sp. CB00851]